MEQWGLLGRMTARPGKRDELIAALKESSRDVPGKLLYLFQLEHDDPDAFWINEIWESKAAYDACLAMPSTGDWGSVESPSLMLMFSIGRPSVSAATCAMIV